MTGPPPANWLMTGVLSESDRTNLASGVKDGRRLVDSNNAHVRVFAEKCSLWAACNFHCIYIVEIEAGKRVVGVINAINNDPDAGILGPLGFVLLYLCRVQKGFERARVTGLPFDTGSASSNVTDVGGGKLTPALGQIEPK